MKVYKPDSIRNVVLAGHSGSGKTSVLETILYNLKMTDRLGRVDDGTSVSDYDPEEVRRKCSINATLVPVEHREHKINFIDLPGYRDFAGEIRSAMRVADGAVIVMDASGHVEVGTELAFEYAHEFGLPTIFLINKMDRERANYEDAVAQLEESFGVRMVASNFPVGAAGSFDGCVNLLKMKMSHTGADGRVTYGDIPAEHLDEAKRLRAVLVEAAAEGDDSLTSKFLDGDSLTDLEILRGLEEDMLDHRVYPVIASSATKGPGCMGLLDFIVECFPPPTHRLPLAATQVFDGQPLELHHEDDEPAVAFVFKTINDPFAGHLSFIKMLSGMLKNNDDVVNTRDQHAEAHLHLSTMRGKKVIPIEELHAGDIGVIAKLVNTHTNDTLCNMKRLVRVAPTSMPPSTVQQAIVAKQKEDEDKLSVAIHRLVEQDPTLDIHRDAVVHQTIIAGLGDLHLDVAVSRLKAQSKVDVDLQVPRVPYRETITRTAQGQGKHKKQSGGRGQFGDCWLKLEPLHEGSGYQFEWAIVGGVIPTKYTQSVQKGVHLAMEKGIIAGYPAVDIRATCYDGSHHSVDSSDIAYQIAASKGFKKVAREAVPVLLEPVYNVRVIVPEQYLGDVMGDLNSRRGRILGMASDERKQIVEATVPLAELFEYGKVLRSITQGRGTFEMTYDHYARVPAELQANIVAEAKMIDEEDD